MLLLMVSPPILQHKCPKKSITSMTPSYHGGIIVPMNMCSVPEKLVAKMELKLNSKYMGFIISIRSLLSIFTPSDTTKNLILSLGWSVEPFSWFSYSSGFPAATLIGHYRKWKMQKNSFWRKTKSLQQIKTFIELKFLGIIFSPNGYPVTKPMTLFKPHNKKLILSDW